MENNTQTEPGTSSSHGAIDDDQATAQQVKALLGVRE